MDMMSMDLQGWEVMEEEEYEFLNVISRGSYAVVHRALDKKKGEMVAVKEEVAESESRGKEVEIHRSLPRHPCIMGFKKAAMKIDDGVKRYVVMEYMEWDLKRGLERSCRPLRDVAIKHIMGRILEGLSFLHSQGVIHMDIKPANILTNNKFDYKICDFGLSKRLDHEAPCTSGAGTVSYMAPEVIAGSSKQTCAVDVWSAGCIMVELVLQNMMFPEIHPVADAQLCYIRECLVHLPKRLASAAWYSGATMLSPAGLDLLQRLLEYLPEKRITAQDALHHTWFTE